MTECLFGTADDEAGGDQTMISVTVDAALREKLNGCDAKLEFRDEQGQLLGHFVPLDPELQEMYDELFDHDLTAEEEARIADDMRNGRWYTTEQVIAHLNALRPSGEP